MRLLQGGLVMAKKDKKVVVDEPVEEGDGEVVEKPSVVKVYRDAAGRTWEVDEDGNRTRVKL